MIDLRRLTLALVLVGPSVACGSEAGEDGVGGAPSAACIAMAEECLAERKVCEGAASQAACVPCPRGEAPVTGTECGGIEGTAWHHDFGEMSLEPGEEHDGLCQSWTLNNDEEIWYRTVEQSNGGGYHHSNWFFVPEHLWNQPDGTWSCREFEFDEALAAFRGGVLYAQSTQTRHQVQVFPAGGIVRIPPRSRIIGATHVFNTGDENLVSKLELTVYQVPPSAEDTALHFFRLNISDIQIPPQSRTNLTGNCDFDAAQAPKTGAPLSMELFYVQPHYHYLGTGFRLEKLGGESDGDVIYDHEGSEPTERLLDPPVDMAGSSGFRFTCRYENAGTDHVGYGIGDQEMCVMLGFARTSVLFDGNVKQSQPVADAGDGLTRYAGDCSVLAAPM